MQVTFKNDLAQAISSSLNVTNTFDMLSKLLVVDKATNDLEVAIKNVMDVFDNALYRQKEMQNNMTSILNEYSLQRSLLEFPLFQKGRVENLIIKSTDRSGPYIKNIYITGLNSSLAKIKANIDYSLVGNEFFANMQDCEYSLIRVVLTEGALVKNLTINKNINEIISFKSKAFDSEWQESLISGSPFFVERSGELFYEGEGITEFEIIVKNTYITNEYFLNIKIILARLEPEISLFKIEYDKEIAINSIFINKFTDGSYMNGNLYFKDKVYNIPFITPPLFGATNVQLETVYTSNFYTIARCPYPLSVNNEVMLYYTMQDSSLLNDWSFSIDQINWLTKDELSLFVYPELDSYQLSPRYMYFKVPGGYENLYIKFTPAVNLNCAWPLSEDGIIYYDGNGISIMNEEKLPVAFDMNFYLPNQYGNFFGFPVGFIGID